MLSIFDYAVIAFYFVFMALMGWVFRNFSSNTSDYFRGGGQMVWWMAGSSAFMTAFSAWTFTGAASKAYQDGPVIMVIFLGNAVGFLFNALYFAPRFRQMRVVTAIEAVRTRFSRGNEQFFTWLQLPLGTLYAGIWLNGLAVFVAAVFGFDLTTTIVVTGLVVLVVSVMGGSWAAVASDFMQVLILMPVTVVAAFLALQQVGGVGSFISKLPAHHLDWSQVARGPIIWLWVGAILLKQFASTNNMLDASRYLNVKDSVHARKAAWLGMVLFIIGPLVWFIPPMAAAITHPDLAAMFPKLEKPSEAAFVASCLATFPAGLIGLLVCGIFAATMSSMDSGLNRNAGFFVKNFYEVVLRPKASERELMQVSKITTVVMGLLVIAAAHYFSQLEKLGLFDLMLQFGTLIALPYSMPLILGMLVKRAPAWAGWTTVVAGFAASLIGKTFITPRALVAVTGWETLNAREASDWVLIVGVFLNFGVCTAWFLGTCLFAGQRSSEEKARVDGFFETLERPVDYEKEEGAANDGQQYRTLGLLCLAYGAFICLLIFIPNPWVGRLCFAFCGGVLCVIGGLLYRVSRKEQEAARTSPVPVETLPAPVPVSVD
jgi:SSS family transporter